MEPQIIGQKAAEYASIEMKRITGDDGQTGICLWRTAERGYRQGAADMAAALESCHQSRLTELARIAGMLDLIQKRLLKVIEHGK